MLRFINCSAECHYAEHRYAECRAALNSGVNGTCLNTSLSFPNSRLNETRHQAAIQMRQNGHNL
jgi:hypothetical protein